MSKLKLVRINKNTYINPEVVSSIVRHNKAVEVNTIESNNTVTGGCYASDYSLDETIKILCAHDEDLCKDGDDHLYDMIGDFNETPRAKCTKCLQLL